MQTNEDGNYATADRMAEALRAVPMRSITGHTFAHWGEPREWMERYIEWWDEHLIPALQQWEEIER